MSSVKSVLFYSFLFFSSVLFVKQSIANGFEMGLFGGAGSIAMGEYNKSIDALNSYNASINVNPSLTKFTYCPMLSLIIADDLNSTAGIWGVYLRNDWLILKQSNDSASWKNNGMAQVLNGDFSVFYSAIGVKFYYTPEGTANLELYVDADAGLCHYYSNYSDESAYNQDGTLLSKQEKRWKTAIPAGSIGAGGSLWLGANTGIGMNCGYRIAAGKIMVSKSEAIIPEYSLQGEDSVDYSGFYVNCGVVYKFSQSAGKNLNKHDETNDSQFLEITNKLYADAQGFYDSGMISMALEKNSEALKLAPDDERLTNQLKMLKQAVELQSGKDNVEKLMQEADDLRRLKKYPEARIKYLEIKAVEPKNAGAQFYLKNFDENGKSLFKKAKKYIASNNPDKALDLAAQAAEFAPENEEITGFYSSLVKSADWKKMADRIFNHAVDSFNKGDYEKAAALWKEVLNINPLDKEAQKNMEKAAAKAEENLGEKLQMAKKAHDDAAAQFKIGNIEAAALKCEYVLRIDPEDLDSKKMLEDINKIRQNENKASIQKR